MKEKITKEQLEIRLAKLELLNSNLVSIDESRCKEFAKVFGWKKSGMYSYQETEPRTPTWPEIFVEVGKLLSLRDFRDFEGNISELGCKLKDIEDIINDVGPVCKCGDEH